MGRAFDAKSMLIGGLVALIGMYCAGAGTFMHGDFNGRFAMVANPGAGIYVLDTATGQVWTTPRDQQRFYEPKLVFETPAEPNWPGE